MWGLHTAVTRSIATCFFPQCLQQVSSKVCNFVNANIDDYKPLCNYLSHTSHLQIKWQLWAYTYAFLPLYFHHISAFESSHVIPCPYVHIMFLSHYLCHPYSPYCSPHFIHFIPWPITSAFWKPSRRPAAPFAGRTPKAERWSLARREVHGVHGTFFLGPCCVKSSDFFSEYVRFTISLVQKYYVCWVPRDHAPTLLFWQHRFRCFWQQEMITERGSTGRNTNTRKDWSWFEW